MMKASHSKELLNSRLYFDIHGHNSGLLPFGWRVASFFRVPKDRSPEEIIKAGLSGGVLCAIGDPASFGIKRYKNTPEVILKQLDDIIKSVSQAGSEIILSSNDIIKAYNSGQGGFVLGVEGGDFLDDDLEAIELVYKKGVRLIAPVHYANNSLGNVGIEWRETTSADAERAGLTEKGERFLKKANTMGIMVDLAHADERTLIEACMKTQAPVICSHTGPRALHNYSRFISDEAMNHIAKTGGLVGLWPAFVHGKGTADTETFKTYARYIRKKIGAEHMALGTDFNGVPGYMKGYRDISESGIFIKLLSEAGFSDHDIEGVVGMNFVRVFNQVVDSVPLARQ